ncbi:hypothetical protein P4G96_14090 [Bacillus cereus]|nr:hypothetical protein [Bacillus cereus]MEB8667279.1 hypothetical protein [Bacillus cereus]
MKQFNGVLKKGSIPIGQSDMIEISLHQFDEIQYKNETYLIVWHPTYNEFIGSHETEKWISHTNLHQSVWIKKQISNILKI